MRPLRLKAQLDGPIQDGEWVHTTEPVVIAWFGPCRETPGNITNFHQVEGKFLSWGRATCTIETNLPPKHHELKSHANGRANPVYAMRVPLSIVARGPLVSRLSPAKKRRVQL